MTDDTRTNAPEPERKYEYRADGLARKLVTELTRERDAARADAARLRTELARLQWCCAEPMPDGDTAVCPVCNGDPFSGHRPDCRLAAALADATPAKDHNNGDKA